MEQITVKILEICQNKNIQVTFMDGRISLEEGKDLNHKILQKVQESLTKNKRMLYQTNNIYEEIKYYW